MNGEEAMKKLLALNIANYSHIVDPAAFLRETENYLAIVQALTGEEFEDELKKLWKEWDEALEDYGTPRSGWKETWKTCGRIRARLFGIMVKKGLIHVTF